MIEEGVSVTSLNLLLNMRNNTDYTTQNLSKKLNKSDIKFGDAVDILNVLGYEIKIERKRNEVTERLDDYAKKWIESIKDIDKSNQALKEAFIQTFLEKANEGDK